MGGLFSFYTEIVQNVFDALFVLFAPFALGKDILTTT
jgi:hypothetical protein